MPTPRRKLSTLAAALRWWWNADADAATILRRAVDEASETTLVAIDAFASQIPEGSQGDGRWWLLTLPEKHAAIGRQRQLRKTALAMAWLDRAHPSLRAWAIEQLDLAPADDPCVMGIRAALTLDNKTPSPSRNVSERDRAWMLGWHAALGQEDPFQSLLEQGVELDRDAGVSLAAWLVLQGRHGLLQMMAKRDDSKLRGEQAIPEALTRDADMLIIGWRRALAKLTPPPTREGRPLDRTGKIQWKLEKGSLVSWAYHCHEAQALSLLLRQGLRFPAKFDPYAHSPGLSVVRATLEARLPLDAEGAISATKYMAHMEDLLRSPPPSTEQLADFDTMLPMFEREIRLCTAHLEGKQWAALLREAISKDAPRIVAIINRNQAGKAPWPQWHTKQTQATNDGRTVTRIDTYFEQALKTTPEAGSDTVLAALACPQVDLCERIPLVIQPKSSKKSDIDMPLGFALAALAPGSLGAWLQQAPGAQLSRLSQETSNQQITQQNVARAMPGDDVWCCALRSKQPGPAIDAMLAHGMTRPAGSPDLHLLALELAGLEQWLSAEVMLDKMPAPTWSSDLSCPSVEKAFLRPFDEDCIERIIGQWPVRHLRTHGGKTLLHDAIGNEDESLVGWLLAAGCDPATCDETGDSALDLVQRHVDKEKWNAILAQGQAELLSSQTATSDASHRPNRL